MKKEWKETDEPLTNLLKNFVDFKVSSKDSALTKFINVMEKKDYGFNQVHSEGHVNQQ